jgi:hypothetical protein
MGKLFQFIFLLGLVILMASPSKANIGAISSEDCLSRDDQYLYDCYIGDIHEEIKKWPLSIEFFQDIDNKKEWLYGVHLIIFNGVGDILFDDVINAPIFVANIPPGTYRLFGHHDGVGRSEMFEIIADTTLNITMHWV